jgi:hypothetical protein
MGGGTWREGERGEGEKETAKRGNGEELKAKICVLVGVSFSP